MRTYTQRTEGKSAIFRNSALLQHYFSSQKTIEYKTTYFLSKIQQN